MLKQFYSNLHFIYIKIQYEKNNKKNQLDMQKRQ